MRAKRGTHKKVPLAATGARPCKQCKCAHVYVCVSQRERDAAKESTQNKSGV